MQVRFHLSRRFRWLAIEDQLDASIYLTFRNNNNQRLGPLKSTSKCETKARIILVRCLSLCRYYYFASPAGPFHPRVLFCSLLLSLPLEPFDSGAGSSLQLGKPKYFDSEN
jgi:hypothetical protein